METKRVTAEMKVAYRQCLKPCASPAAFMALGDLDKAWIKSFGSKGISRQEYEAAWTAMADEVIAEMAAEAK